MVTHLITDHRVAVSTYVNHHLLGLREARHCFFAVVELLDILTDEMSCKCLCDCFFASICIFVEAFLNYAACYIVENSPKLILYDD